MRSVGLLLCSIFGIGIGFSCYSQKNEIDSQTIPIECNFSSDLPTEDWMVNDEFISSLVTEVLSWSELEPNLPSAVENTVVSPHSNSLNNTIITSVGSKSFYLYYSNEETTFPVCLDVHSGDFLGQIFYFLKRYQFANITFEKPKGMMFLRDTEDTLRVRIKHADGKVLAFNFTSNYID